MSERYLVDVLHNVTRTDDGRMAIFDRLGGPCALPGDSLTHVGSLTVEAASVPDALEAVFEAGNADLETDAVREYRSWRVRSLCAGDVLAIRGIDGPAFPRLRISDGDLADPQVFVCELTGWTQVALGI